MPVLYRSHAQTRRTLNPLSWPARGRRWAVGGLLAVAIAGCAATDTMSTGGNQAQPAAGDEADAQRNAATADALALRGDLSPAESGSAPLGTVAAAPIGQSAPDGGSGAGSGSPAAPSTAAPATPATASPPTIATSSTVPASSMTTPTAPSGATPSSDQATGESAEPSAPPSATSQPPSTAPATAQAPVAASSTPSTVPPPPGTDSPEGLSQGEARSYALLGDLRSSLGVDPLGRDPELDALARDWSRHMAETGDFRHSDSPYGENIAFTSNTRLTASEAAEVFQRLWVESEVHYQNMTGAYVRVGIGLYRTERGWYGTHVFAY